MGIRYGSGYENAAQLWGLEVRQQQQNTQSGADTVRGASAHGDKMQSLKHTWDFFNTGGQGGPWSELRCMWNKGKVKRTERRRWRQGTQLLSLSLSIRPQTQEWQPSELSLQFSRTSLYFHLQSLSFWGLRVYGCHIHTSQSAIFPELW